MNPELEQENWTDLHSDFAEKTYWRRKNYQQKWEELGINYAKAQEWIKVGFEPVNYEQVEQWKNRNFTFQQVGSWLKIGIKIDEVELVKYLEEQSYHPNNLQIQEIIDQTSWRDLHPNFTYSLRQGWEQAGFNHEKVRELIEIGFEPKDYHEAKRMEKKGIKEIKKFIASGFSKENYLKKIQDWEKNDFSLQQIQVWLEVGLKADDHELATYLRWKNVTESNAIDLGKLKKDFEELPMQAYLDCFYSRDRRNSIARVEIIRKNLIGSLETSDFINLKNLNCRGNKINNLILPQSNQLKWIWASNNFLVKFNFNPLNLETLIFLDLRNNDLETTDLSVFSSLVNLKELEIGNHDEIRIKNKFYNRWIGSLISLQNCTQLNKLDIANTDIYSGLRYLPLSIENFNCSFDKRPESKIVTIAKLFVNEQKEDMNFRNFSSKLRSYKKWRKLNFNKELIQEWISAGARIDDHDFIVWLKNVKKETRQWIINYQADYQLLSRRFKDYGLCADCQQPNTGERWCKDCNVKHSETIFSQLKQSDNAKIDAFIQQLQLTATEANKFLEWIPYQQFNNVEYLAEGGFGKVYQANWEAGNIKCWDRANNQWKREKEHYYEAEAKKQQDFEQNKDKYKKYKDYREVVLKILANSQNSTDFLDEAAKHKIIDDWFNNIVPCYGLSQAPDGNYLLVMQYLPERDLRNYLRNNNRELKKKLKQEKKSSQEIESKKYSQDQEILKNKQEELSKLRSEITNHQINKISQLVNITRGLKDIHQKNLIHRDFHSGNILKGIEQASCLITDLGLCKPANEISQEEKIFGILPYVAPEVLQGKVYTQAADIYSYGIIAYELLSGLPPYYDQAHDVNLGVAICQGLRPQFQIKIPQLLEDLINQCWANDPAQRPTANEIEKTLRSWQEDSEFKKQLQEAEKYNQNLPPEVRFPNYQIHHGAVYHSKLLPTKEITRILQISNLSSCSTIINLATEQIIFPTRQITRLLGKIQLDQIIITEEIKELAREFIRANLAKLRNKNDKETKVAIKQLKQELKAQGFNQASIDEVIKFCEDLMAGEEEEAKTLVQQIEISTKEC